MGETSHEEGLRVVDSSDDDAEIDREAADDRTDLPSSDGRVELETLRDEFVSGFNARSLDTILGIVHADVETPDVAGDGAAVLAEELDAIWERSPGAILTRAFLDGSPCAVAWLPDEDGCWSRAALVCFDCDRSLLSLVAVPDDPDSLERAEAEDPTGEELEEWSDWSEWERGEETQTRSRDRTRP